MAATEQGVWGLQDVRDKQLAGEWSYDGASQLWALGGGNGTGALGLNNLTSYSSPKLIQSATDWTHLNSYYDGQSRQAIRSNGTLYTWGYNNWGQLGHNDTRNSPTDRNNRSSATQIPGTTWDNGATGYDSQAAIKTDGTLWTWGVRSALGISPYPSNGHRSSPVQVGTDTNWSSLSGMDNGFTAIKTDGTLWSWGASNNPGELGQNNRTQFSSPVQIGTDTNWSKLSNSGYGRYHSGCIKTDGTLWLWGGVNYGINVAPMNRSSPVQVPGTWDNFGGGSNATVGVKSDNTLWVWGRNDEGQLGQNEQGPGTSNSRSSPVQIPGSWLRGYSAARYMYGIKTDNTLWAWGGGAPGRLGLNNKTDYSSPVQIPGTWEMATGGSEGAASFALSLL